MVNRLDQSNPGKKKKKSESRGYALLVVLDLEHLDLALEPLADGLHVAAEAKQPLEVLELRRGEGDVGVGRQNDLLGHLKLAPIWTQQSAESVVGGCMVYGGWWVVKVGPNVDTAQPKA